MKSNRRDFLKSVVVIGGGLVASQMAFAEGRRSAKPSTPAAAGGDLPLVKPGEGMAGSVHYVHNKKDLKDASLKTERNGVKFEGQGCSSCMLYTKHGMQGGEEVGKCTLFQNQVVKATGWCGSWSKKV